MRQELKQFELIEEYVNGKLSGAELDSFKRELENSSELQEMVAFQELAKQAALRSALRSEINEIATGSSGSFFKSWMIIAGIIVTLGALTTGIYLYQEETEEPSVKNPPHVQQPITSTPYNGPKSSFCEQTMNSTEDMGISQFADTVHPLDFGFNDEPNPYEETVTISEPEEPSSASEITLSDESTSLVEQEMNATTVFMKAPKSKVGKINDSEPCYTLFINEEGVSEGFSPWNGTECRKYKLVISDKRDNIVFESNTPGQLWYGTNKKEVILPKGTYHFSESYKVKGESRTFSGLIKITNQLEQ